MRPNIHLDSDDMFRVDRSGDDPVLRLGGFPVYFDSDAQLEELHGTIGQHLMKYRPDPVAKAFEPLPPQSQDGPRPPSRKPPLPPPVIPQDETEEYWRQRRESQEHNARLAAEPKSSAMTCPECGADIVDLTAQKLGHYCLKCGFVEAGDPAPTAKACEPDRRELIQRRMPSRERIQQVIDKSKPPAMACPACGEAMVLMHGDHPCWRCFQCGNAVPVSAEAATGSEEPCASVKVADHVLKAEDMAPNAMLARSKSRRDEIYRHADERRDAQRAAKDGERAMGLAVDVNCPDCGSVNVKADVWEYGKPISGECPKCGERLYFDSPSKPRASVKAAGPALEIDEMMHDMASSFEIDQPRCQDSGYGCSEEQLEAVAQRQTPEVP